MAEGNIPNPNIMPNKSTMVLPSGTSSASVISTTQIKYGKMVFTSARISIPNAVTNGMDLPLLRLNQFIPADGQSSVLPSFARIGTNTYADVVLAEKYPDGTYYIKQRAISNISANSTIELFFCYGTK